MTKSTMSGLDIFYWRLAPIMAILPTLHLAGGHVGLRMNLADDAKRMNLADDAKRRKPGEGWPAHNAAPHYRTNMSPADWERNDERATICRGQPSAYGDNGPRWAYLFHARYGHNCAHTSVGLVGIQHQADLVLVAWSKISERS